MNHENTRLYQTSLELVGQCAELIERFPSGLGFLGDQLRRASASVPLNFADLVRDELDLSAIQLIRHHTTCSRSQQLAVRR